MAARAPTVGIKGAFLEAIRMKSGIVGFAILISLLAVTVVIPVYAPYDIVRQWSNVNYWLDNPRVAAPEWTQIFTGKEEPKTTTLASSTFRYVEVRTTIDAEGQVFNLTLINASRKFFWTFDGFPSELSMEITAFFPGNTSDVPGESPLIQIFWNRPDGQYVLLLQRTIPAREFNLPTTYHLSTDSDVIGNIRDWVQREGVISPGNVSQAYIRPETVLFAKMDSHQLDPQEAANLLTGEYQVVVSYTGFSLVDTVRPDLTIYGSVYGIAGTDFSRRDLMTGVLWGAPVALAFGVTAAVVVVLIQAILGAFSGWYGGPIDEFLQRASDFYLIIPILPILIMIALFYTPGIWAILFVVVAFSIVGSTTKVVRSIVLQIREEQFIEAAQSYGASRGRILFRYIMPRIMPYTFALVALSVPAFIFLEASLSFLGLGDPVLPTWGSIIGQAYNEGALFYGWWWWVAFPTIGIVYTTVGFALMGYAFDKVLNPRLREE